MSNPSCFIIMPLTTPSQFIEAYKGDSDHFIHVLDHLLKPAIESAGLEPVPPISKGSEVIHGDIIRNLETADLVLCDMSILNPNVFFELGIRTALNKSVAMIRDNVTQRVPFDTTIINYHEYDSGLEPWNLDQEIEKLTYHLKDCLKNGSGNSLWGYFSMTQQAEVPSDAPEVEKQLSYLIKKVEGLSHPKDYPEKNSLSLKGPTKAFEGQNYFSNEYINTFIKQLKDELKHRPGFEELEYDYSNNGLIDVYLPSRLAIDTKNNLKAFARQYRLGLNFIDKFVQP